MTKVPQPQQAHEQILALMEEIELLERFPGAVEYLAHVFQKFPPGEFYTSKERFSLTLRGVKPEVLMIKNRLAGKIPTMTKMEAINWLRLETGMSLNDAKIMTEQTANEESLAFAKRFHYVGP